MSTSRHLAFAGALLGAFLCSAASPPSHAAPPAGNAAPAAAPAKTRTAQQQRMADCSHQAKADGKKGADRRTFMSSCLKGQKAGAAAVVAGTPKPKAKAAPAQPPGTQR